MVVNNHLSFFYCLLYHCLIYHQQHSTDIHPSNRVLLVTSCQKWTLIPRSHWFTELGRSSFTLIGSLACLWFTLPVKQKWLFIKIYCHFDNDKCQFCVVNNEHKIMIKRCLSFHQNCLNQIAFAFIESLISPANSCGFTSTHFCNFSHFKFSARTLSGKRGEPQVDNRGQQSVPLKLLSKEC